MYSHPLKQKRVAVKIKRINRSDKFQLIPGLYVLKEDTLVMDMF